jgi:hypothetical protein
MRNNILQSQRCGTIQIMMHSLESSHHHIYCHQVIMSISVRRHAKDTIRLTNEPHDCPARRDQQQQQESQQQVQR